MINASGFNDKKKLADARALAQSFSKAKPANRSKSYPKKNNMPPRPQAMQLRSHTRVQLTQSIVRPAALSSAAMTNHRQPKPALAQGRVAQASAPATWKPSNQLGSVTGGRALDFLTRKDAPEAVVEKPVATPAATAQSEAISSIFNSLPTTTAPTNGPQSSVLNTFYALMSQQEKETANFDPLVDKMKQWQIQSPSVTKVGAKSSIEQSRSCHPLFNVQPAPPAVKKETKTAGIEQTTVADKKENVPPIEVLANGSTRTEPTDPNDPKASPTSEELPKIHVRLPPTPQPTTAANSPVQISGSATTPQGTAKETPSTTAAVKQKIRAAMDAAVQDVPTAAVNDQKRSLDYPSTPLSTPNAKITMIEQQLVPAHPSTPTAITGTKVAVDGNHSAPPRPNMLEMAGCTCKPVVKKPRGLGSSRYASKEATGSPFANQFSVDFAVTVHQEFCTLYKSESGSSHSSASRSGSGITRLRPSAEPFTPTPRR